MGSIFGGGGGPRKPPSPTTYRVRGGEGRAPVRPEFAGQAARHSMGGWGGRGGPSASPDNPVPEYMLSMLSMPKSEQPAPQSGWRPMPSGGASHAAEWPGRPISRYPKQNTRADPRLSGVSPPPPTISGALPPSPSPPPQSGWRPMPGGVPPNRADPQLRGLGKTGAGAAPPSPRRAYMTPGGLGAATGVSPPPMALGQGMLGARPSPMAAPMGGMSVRELGKIGAGAAPPSPRRPARPMPPGGWTM